MLNGWIMLHRKTLDNWVSQEPELLSVWVRLLLEANHADTKRMFNGCHIEVKRGQLIFGLNAFSLKSGVSESKLRRYISLLEKDGMINRQKTNKYSIISIVNFDSHQGDDRQSAGKAQANNNQSAGKQQHRNNVNNINNKEKIEEDKSATFKKPKVKVKVKSKTESGDEHKVEPSQRIVDMYNELLPECPRWSKVTPKRSTAIKSFLKRRNEDLPNGEKYTPKMFAGYLACIRDLQGWALTENEKDGITYQARSLEFFLKEDFYIQTLEKELQASKRRV